MSKPSKAHMGAAKYLLHFLAESVNFSITYMRKRFKLAAYSDANWGNNPDNGKPTSSYIFVLANGPISCKVGLQSLIAQSTMGAELMTAVFTMKEAVFCSNMVMELGFEKESSSVPMYLGNTSALHATSKRTYSLRAKLH